MPGANGVRMVRPAHAHVHVVNTRQHQQQSQQAQHLQRQQQELQQQLGTCVQCPVLFAMLCCAMYGL